MGGWILMDKCAQVVCGSQPTHTLSYLQGEGETVQPMQVTNAREKE